MKIFLINLDRSPDRLQYMSAQFNRLNLPFERVAAVDGRTLDMEKLDAFADRARVEEWKELLTPNAIGASLSHYQIYKKMVDENIEMALILEDDIELGNNLPTVLQEIEAHGLNNQDVFLVYIHGQKKFFSSQGKMEIAAGYSFYRPLSVWGTYSAGGYILKKDVARRLAQHVFPVSTTADSWGTFHRDGVIGGLWTLFPLITKSANFGSDIGYSKLNKIIRFLEKVPFLPFNLIFTKFRRMLKKGDSPYEIVPEAPNWVVKQFN